MDGHVIVGLPNPTSRIRFDFADAVDHDLVSEMAFQATAELKMELHPVDGVQLSERHGVILVEEGVAKAVIVVPRSYSQCSAGKEHLKVTCKYGTAPDGAALAARSLCKQFS